MAKKRVPTEETFLKDVAKHKMTVQNDSGVHRNIRFADPATSNMYFMLTTWPGHLCISGDMGTYVFNRLLDMFEFFRCKPSDAKVKLYINTGYWEEKCEAEDRRTNGIWVYDEDMFRSAIGDRFNQHDWESKKDKKACWEEIRSEVFSCGDNEHDARSAADRFRFKGEYDHFEFTDFWETRLRDYTYQYIWCCYAIVWGIQQYDSAHTTVAEVMDSAGEVLHG